MKCTCSCHVKRNESTIPDAIVKLEIIGHTHIYIVCPDCFYSICKKYTVFHIEQQVEEMLNTAVHAASN